MYGGAIAYGDDGLDWNVVSLFIKNWRFILWFGGGFCRHSSLSIIGQDGGFGCLHIGDLCNVLWMMAKEEIFASSEWKSLMKEE